MQTNQEILATCTAAFDLRPGPRVGDFLRLPRPDERVPEFTRFTHKWEHTIQTGGTEHGSYFIYKSGGLEYSGGLDPGVALADLIPTESTKPAAVWFFDRGLTGPGRGVTFQIPCRIFHLRDGAETSGLYELGTRYHLMHSADPVGCGYHWTITRNSTSHTAFRTLPELEQWLTTHRYRIAQDPHTPHQAILFPA